MKNYAAREHIMRSALRRLLLTAAALSALNPAAAQTPPPAEFAVASVKPNVRGNSGVEGSESEKITVSPVGVTMRNITLRSCLVWAYDVRDSQLTSLSWLASEHFDIDAKAAGPVSPDQLRPMMQKLLADRFRLELHRESKDVPVYGMTIAAGKASKFKPASGGEKSMLPLGGGIVFRNYSMRDLADRLSSRPFKLDRTVVDETGLTDSFDFIVNFAEDEAGMKHTLEGMEQGNADQATSMLTILHEQLGLNFKARKAHLDTLVIDRGEKVPLGN